MGDLFFFFLYVSMECEMQNIFFGTSVRTMYLQYVGARLETFRAYGRFSKKNLFCGKVNYVF